MGSEDGIELSEPPIDSSEQIQLSVDGLQPPIDLLELLGLPIDKQACAEVADVTA